jgi:tRNA threonylcarbamoyladenosine biosynthesis protein TsaB
METANAVTSIAISENGHCIAEKTILEPNKATDKLHRLVEALLAETSLAFSSLNAIAISAGPGSYTGLRIATVAAKGYCFALNIPLIAIPTLQAMTHGIRKRYHFLDIDFYVPMIDARRMEVFTSFFNEELECIQYFPSLIIDEHSVELFQQEKKYLLFGNGATKVIPFLNTSNLIISKAYSPSAEDICELSFERFKQQKFEDIAYYEPSYYKAFHSTQKSK